MVTRCLKCIIFIQYLSSFQKIQVALPLPSDVSAKVVATTASHFGSDKETTFGFLAVAGSPLQICAKCIDIFETSIKHNC